MTPPWATIPVTAPDVAVITATLLEEPPNPELPRANAASSAAKATPLRGSQQVPR